MKSKFATSSLSVRSVKITGLRIREVYMDLAKFKQEAKEQLTLQSFTCTTCGDIRMFQEKNCFDHTMEKHLSIIEYTEVINE